MLFTLENFEKLRIKQDISLCSAFIAKLLRWAICNLGLHAVGVFVYVSQTWLDSDSGQRT